MYNVVLLVGCNNVCFNCTGIPSLCPEDSGKVLLTLVAIVLLQLPECHWYLLGLMVRLK